jgi:hypothetical protein
MNLVMTALLDLARMECDLGMGICIRIEEGKPVVRGPIKIMIDLGNQVAFRIEKILDDYLVEFPENIVVSLRDPSYQLSTGTMSREVTLVPLHRPELTEKQQKIIDELERIEKKLNKKGWSMG